MCIRDSPQGDLTTCLGWQNQDSLPTTLATVMEKVIRDEPFTTDEGILHHSEGVDLMPANLSLIHISKYQVDWTMFNVDMDVSWQYYGKRYDNNTSQYNNTQRILPSYSTLDAVSYTHLLGKRRRLAEAGCPGDC